MPQPYNGRGMGWGPNTIFDRPELAPLAANVCANWVLIEQQLAWLFALLLAGEYSPDEPNSSSQFHPLGFQILDVLNNIPTKLDLIERLLAWWKLDDELEEFRSSLRRQISKRARERNAVAHGLWAVDEEDLPDALILASRDGSPSLVYRKNDFEDASIRIIELEDKLKKFTHSVHKTFLERKRRGPLAGTREP